MFTIEPVNNDYPVVQDDDPILKQVSQPVTEFGPTVRGLVMRMLATMHAKNGRGLAAVQLGVLRRVIVARVPDETYMMVNPVITRALKRDTVEREGCLSIHPSKWRKVARPAKCEMTWQDMEGNTHSKGFSGDLARILQHEMDHLDGILITDKPYIG